MTRDDFKDLVQKLNRKLYGYAYRILGNQEEAEDAVQEIFIKLWKLKENLEEYNSIDAVATTMTKNYCIDQVRKKKRRINDDYGKQDFMEFSAPSPHDQFENRESGEILHFIISSLPESNRQIIRLKEIEGLSYEEIAKITGQTVNAARVAVSRARSMIREEYTKYHYERQGFKTIT